MVYTPLYTLAPNCKLMLAHLRASNAGDAWHGWLAIKTKDRICVVSYKASLD